MDKKIIATPTTEELYEELERVRGRKRFLKLLYYTVASLIVVAAAAVLVSMLFLPVLRVTGTSMTPTLHSDLPDFMRKIREMGFRVKLDTNGTNPGMLKQIVGEGLADYVAMDVKNTMAKYPLTVGIPDAEQQMLEKIRESIAFLMEDTVPYEFRTTVVSAFHTCDSIRGAAELIRGAKRYFLQKFVDSGALLKPGLTGCTREEMEKWRKRRVKSSPTPSFAVCDESIFRGQV